MNKIIFFTLLIFFDRTAFSQITFRGTYASDLRSNAAGQLLRLKDHGSLILGTQSDSIIYCVRLDSIGNLIQSKTFSTEFSETRPKGTVTQDGGFVFMSESYDRTNSTYQGGLVVKCNREGDILWTKRLRSKKYSHFLPSIVFEDSHGGIILAYMVMNDKYYSTTIELVRIDKDANVTWHITFDSQQTSVDIYNANCIAELNNEIFVGGNINYQWDYYTDGSILRINSKGKILSFKRISSQYSYLNILKLWIKNNMLYAFADYKNRHGYFDNCFLYIKNTSDQAHAGVVNYNVFSVQHYLELHKEFLPLDLETSYYEKNGSYVRIANYRDYEIAKFDSLGRICPDFVLPGVDTMLRNKSFTVSDKSYAIYPDSLYFKDVVVTEAMVDSEAIVCRGSADQYLNNVKINRQELSLHNVAATLSPNPANNLITLKYYCASIQQASIVITASDGKIMQSEKLLLEPGINTPHINVESLSSGLYFLKIKQHDKLTVLKFIKN